MYNIISHIKQNNNNNGCYPHAIFSSLPQLPGTMPSIFPPEIEETILDFLAEDDGGHSALKTCSLVCQAFLHMCRKHIFGNIILSNASEYNVGPSLCFTTRAFERLLRETPEIADYIHKLEFSIRNEDLTNPSIQESLKRISKVEFLTVRHRGWPIFEWNNNPLRPALLHLLHLPTLTHFKVAAGIRNFVVSDLIPCVNLKYFDIGGYTTVAVETTFPVVFPEHSIQLNEFVVGIGSDAAMKLCKTRRPDGHPIISLGSLSKITVAFEKPNEGQASLELFRHCHSLTNAHISCKRYLYHDHQDF